MRSAIQILYEHSSPGAAFNSKDRYDPPKCHPNTRTGFLNTTRNWTRNGPSQILWLYGSAGAGKSAIAQTLAMELRAGSNLAASFFFSRTAHLNSHRGHEGRFITTIAYQLTEIVPGLQRFVEHVIATRPSVFDLTLTEQVVALIIEPLRELQLDTASHEGTPCVLPRVLVIDGLDECNEEAGQIQVLEALATLISHQEVFPCSVFLASRPELVIRSWITKKQSENPQFLRSISLLDHCDSDHDIEVFMNDETAEIKQSHPLKYLIPAGWPSPEFIKEIIRRASGQFVYASTIIKYIKDLRGDPTERLDAILKHTLPSDDRPYADLDALYLHILRQTKHPKLVHQILAFRVTTNTFRGQMLGVDSRGYLRILLSLPHSVHTLLIDLQSIMNCDEDGMQLMGHDDEATTYPAVFHHASLLEFLLDPHRSEEFYINILSVDKELCETTLRQLSAESSLTVADEQYIIYCFLILLQTQTSYHPSYSDQVVTQLARWDTLHNQMLYMILCVLHDNFSSPDGADIGNTIDRVLWSVFAPAVARMRLQWRQEFASARLPLELLVMYQTDHLFATYPGLRGNPPRNLFEWHVKGCIKRDTGVDAWHFCSLKKHQFLLKNYRESQWHEFMHVLDKYLPPPEKDALDIENLQRHAIAEWQALVPSAASFMIKHLISMLV
ncbi:hypothetical protein BJ165DRAFT_116629 [Panaeolus papilionaceus]|nr:hypothetical protein BJ165DRAFT_116629 [Panaeolus papilionaceus]